jgi:hypothetical protein
LKIVSVPNAVNESHKRSIDRPLRGLADRNL